MTDAGGAPAEVLAEAAGAGIHRIPVPTPFAVGAVNCYLIEDDPLTLVDVGPNLGNSLAALVTGLREHGHELADLELIVLTHQHLDHIGLLEVLAERSGAEIAALGLLAPWLAEFPASAEADDSYAQELMRRHGVPDDLASALRLVADAFRPYGSGGQVTRVLSEGEMLELRDHRFEIQHRPGHSPTDTLLWEPDQRILLAGDHLLAHISSNATVSRPLDPEWDGATRPRPLITYSDSLLRTRELPARIVLGGHGDPVTGHAELIDSRLKMHDRRARKILKMIREEPLTAFEIAQSIWGNVAVTQAFLTLSEVLGHIDLLLADGRVREQDDGEVVRFCAP